MLIDGERLKHLLRKAEKRIILCAPFIKLAVIKILLKNIHDHVHVKIVTRWNPSEIAAGVSDLDVYEFSKKRPNTELLLLDELHAKLYVADDECLLGSANLTATALGWAQRNNVELLVGFPVEHEQIMHLLRRIDGARLATYAEKTEMEEKAASLPSQQLEEGQSVLREEDPTLAGVWFPRCAAPEKLFDIYSNHETNSVVSGTREDALHDLLDLAVPNGLNRQEFCKEVSQKLEGFPSFALLLEQIPMKLTDKTATDIVSSLRPELNSGDAFRQWKIIRDWINEFFNDKFEIAAESYVVRIKS